MLGSFLTRVFIMALGYGYPAYECFKTVEKNKANTEQLRFWCQYWILVAVSTIFERVGDAFIAWVPMYSEAKLAFFIYLWYPKTRGTTYVYDTFFRPYLLMHEEEIDSYLLELKARVGNAAGAFFQKAATYGQTRFYDILQYLASQSQYTGSQPAQQRLQQHASRSLPIAAPAQEPPEARIQQHSLVPTSAPPVRNQSLERKQEAAAGTTAPTSAPPDSTDASSSPRSAPPGSQALGRPSDGTEVEDLQVDQASSSAGVHKSNPQPKESIFEGIRARLRIKTSGNDVSSNH